MHTHFLALLSSHFVTVFLLDAYGIPSPILIALLGSEEDENIEFLSKSFQCSQYKIITW